MIEEAVPPSLAARAREETAVAQETEEGWAALDRFAIRERSQRLMRGMARCGSPRLADFDVVRKLGMGSNAIVYLAKCSVDGQLSAHADTLVVLKVLVHYKQDGARDGEQESLRATSSALDRVFTAEVRSPGTRRTVEARAANSLNVNEPGVLPVWTFCLSDSYYVSCRGYSGDQVEREARGPDVEEFRDNIVHVLGTFVDTASELEEYAALDTVRIGCPKPRP